MENHFKCHNIGCLDKVQKQKHEDITPPLEASNPTLIDPEKSNWAEAQDRNFKIAILNMFKDLKEDMNKMP